MVQWLRRYERRLKRRARQQLRWRRYVSAALLMEAAGHVRRLRGSVAAQKVLSGAVAGVIAPDAAKDDLSVVSTFAPLLAGLDRDSEVIEL